MEQPEIEELKKKLLNAEKEINSDLQKCFLVPGISNTWGRADYEELFDKYVEPLTDAELLEKAKSCLQATRRYIEVSFETEHDVIGLEDLCAANPKPEFDEVCQLYNEIESKVKTEVCPIALDNALSVMYERGERRHGVFDMETGKIARQIERNCLSFPLEKRIPYVDEKGVHKLDFLVGVNKEPEGQHGRLGYIAVQKPDGKEVGRETCVWSFMHLPPAVVSQLTEQTNDLIVRAYAGKLKQSELDAAIKQVNLSLEEIPGHVRDNLPRTTLFATLSGVMTDFVEQGLHPLALSFNAKGIELYNMLSKHIARIDSKLLSKPLIKMIENQYYEGGSKPLRYADVMAQVQDFEKDLSAEDRNYIIQFTTLADLKQKIDEKLSKPKFDAAVQQMFDIWAFDEACKEIRSKTKENLERKGIVISEDVTPLDIYIIPHGVQFESQNLMFAGTVTITKEGDMYQNELQEVANNLLGEDIDAKDTTINELIKGALGDRLERTVTMKRDVMVDIYVPRR